VLQRLLAATAIFVCAAFAQSSVATITGIVTDQTGAAVPSAEVVLTNTATSVVTRTQTNTQGIFLAPSLLPGPYRASIGAAGFSKREVKDIELRVGQQFRLDVALEVGNITESVQVTAEAEQLQRETAEISQTLTSHEIRNLPLNNRNPYALMQFTSGISAGGADPSGLDYADRVSINGSRSRGNSFIIDGASSLHIGGIGERIGSIEAFSEAKVLTNTYSAEYGRTAGGVMVFSIKSGTNDYHGTAYEYHRNSKLNAANWADNASGRTPATRQLNEFGGTLGGPVPGLRNKLFFFGSYEGQRDKTPQIRRRTIPDNAVRQGNFSGVSTIIYDPLTRQPFPGNIIPANRIDPAAAKWVSMLPAPNSDGTLNRNFGIANDNFLFPGKSADWARNFGIGRADYVATDNDRFFVTFAHVNEERDEGNDLPNALNNIRGKTPRNMRRLTINYTRIFSPSLSNELLAHAMRDNRTQHPWYGDFDASRELGIQRTPVIGMPTVQISGGYGNYGWSRFEEWINQPAGLNNTTTFQSGRHTMRFGGQLFQNQFWYKSAGQVAGTYNFNGEITGLGAPGRNNPLNSFADFLLGAVKTSDIPVVQIPVNRTNYNLGLFFNDSWKVTQRLTLNLGLRYEFETRQIVKNNIYSRADITTGELLVAGRNASRNLNLENDFLNFGPRLGATYALGDKTVIRGGYATFYSNFWMDNGEMVAFPGFTGSRAFTDLGAGRAQAFTFSQGMPLEGLQTLTDPFEELAAARAAGRQLAYGGAPSYANRANLPSNTQYNVMIQRGLPFDMVLEFGYVGSRLRNQPRSVSANSPGLEAAQAVSTGGVSIERMRPFPQYNNFNAVLYDARGNYNSFQTNLTRRFSKGFSVDGSFTWSKNIDTASGFSDSNQMPWRYPEIERAVSALDRPRMVTVGWIWELPFGRGQRFFSGNRLGSALLGGWNLNGIFSASDGLPFTITQRNNNLVLSAQRPDVRDPSRLNGQLDNPYFMGNNRVYLIQPNDPNFPFVPSGALTLGTNLAVYRNFRITERFNAQFRSEAYNAFNNVNFRPPASTNINDANYGLINAASPARQILLGVRVSF
jgi:hypothetical protein